MFPGVCVCVCVISGSNEYNCRSVSQLFGFTLFVFFSDGIEELSVDFKFP